MSPANRCTARTKNDGDRCRKSAILGTDYCFFHIDWSDVSDRTSEANTVRDALR